MKRTPDEIINALKVIKDVCSSVHDTDDPDCGTCPLRLDLSLDKGICGILGEYPVDWDIKEPKEWTAF